jgi:hypothetical protein
MSSTGYAAHLRTITRAAIEKREADDAARADREFMDLWKSFTAVAANRAADGKFDAPFSFVERGSNAIFPGAVERFYARLSADGFTLGERLIDCDLTTVKIGWEESADPSAPAKEVVERTVVEVCSCSCGGDPDACLACNPDEDSCWRGMSAERRARSRRLEATRPDSQRKEE